MKLQKALASLIIGILFLMITGISSVVMATVVTNPIYLGVTELRTNDEPNMGYSIGNPKSGGSKLWNIVEYTSAAPDASIKADGHKNIYCVKAEVGFNDTRRRASYNVFYDMKRERDQIKAQNDVLKSIVEGTIDIGTKTISKYDALLAASDMLYLPGESTLADKEELLKEIIDYAKQHEYDYELMEEYPLTDDDISSIQQAALWYFTNYGEKDGKFDKTDETSWLWYTLTGSSEDYHNLTGYNPHGLQPQHDAGQARSYQAEILYNIIINKAKANADNYSDPQKEVEPAVVDTTVLNYEEAGTNYVVGPIHITEKNSIPYTIDFTVKNGETQISNYKLLNSSKQEVPEGTSVKDLVGQDFYVSLSKDNINNIAINIKINYNESNLTLWASTTNNEEQPVMIPEKNPKVKEYNLTTTPDEREFDLALRKYITKINGKELKEANSRVPNIDESTLESGTTAIYKHRKAPVEVETGDKVTYKLTIYNEGEKEGRATKIVDQLPTGLKYTNVVSGNFQLGVYSETTNLLRLIRKDGNTDNLEPYTPGHLDSETIEIECEVVAIADKQDKKVLTNVAWISEEYNAEDDITITNQEKADRDSEPATKPDVNKDNMSDYKGFGNKDDLTDPNYYYKGQQDDDDFEKLVLMPQSFDLKLVKRITEVNGQNVPERIEKVDVSKLNTIGPDGELVTTADYTLNKDPVGVKKGDIVTYTFRVYNEGTIDGYVSEITEDIPEGLEFIFVQSGEEASEEEKAASDFNMANGWSYADSSLETIKTTYLSLYPEINGTKENIPHTENMIKAFGSNDGSKTEADLYYKEISVKMEVTSEDIAGTVIRNEAEISDDSDVNGNPIDDRDSQPEIWIGKYDHDHYQDDEDYDNCILQSFDLSLRKFTVAVSKDTNIENDEYLKNSDGSYIRAPKVDTSKLNTLDENDKMITTAIYNHTKEPILVQPNDIVVYMLRVYNEGDMDGYASGIKDHLPPYLEFVEGEFNAKYKWEVSEDGRTVKTDYLKDSKLNKAVKNESPLEAKDTYTLSYAEVPIMCKVKDNAKTSENITNIADITVYEDENHNTVTDRDSQVDNVVLPEDEKLPGYKDDEKGEYVPGQQDDDDFEKVNIKIFDLALRKWVTQAIVIENAGTTVTETGHQPYDDPEQVVKVELHRKKINDVTVKFRFSIRVINEGEIAGYAKEVTDYVPQGLTFMAEDNKGWTDRGNNVISTRLLENTLLQPGEYADVEVVLTWINSQDNMGVMVNTAEISEDYNEYGIPDIDSTPNNKKQGEDDIDDAPVMVSISTGQMRIYFTLGFIILVTIAGGVVLIKKYVL